MDKFLESIIQAAKDAGAKDIDIAKNLFRRFDKEKLMKWINYKQLI